MNFDDDSLWIYNAQDCVRTFEIAETHEATIPALGLEYPFEFQMTMFWLVLDTMIRGVRFDQARRSNFALMLQDEIAKRDQWFIDVLGHPLKPSSGKQMKALFYDDLKLPIQKNRKTGNPSLDDEALNKLAVKEPLIQPIVRRISEWRSLGVFFSTFVQAPLDRDNRMRCSYNVAGTDTYRFSSSENAFGSGCVPADAEVLTRDGWQSIATVTEGQYIAQWDNGSVTFVPTSPYRTQYKGLWYVGAGEQFNVCLTAEHRVLLQDKYLQRSFELPAKQAATRSNVVLPLGGKINGPLTISCPKLLVAVLADGSYEGTVIRISFTKQRKIDRLLSLFTEYGIEWWENASKPGYRRFVFRPPSDWPTEKRWGWWVTGLRKEVAEEMLEECRYWDGTDRGTSFWFFSADKEQAEIVATLAHLCGRAATIRREEQNEGSYSDTVMWIVNVKPRGYARLQSKHWTTQPYEGEVYCVTVPSSYWLMRYRGKISVTGNTNLQNIPKGGEEADGLELPNVRSLFLPDSGKIIFDTDLSSADLRIVVWESDEPEMKQILADGNNPYIMIAREFYRDPTIQKKLPNGAEHPKYRTFKSLAHGTHYLGSPRGLAMRLGLSVNEVERVQNWYFARFPRIREWQEHVKDTLRKHHYVTNAFGYRKFYFDRIDDDVFREAAAWIPQSSVALYINHIWARFVLNIPGLEILLQVHDSLVGQFDRAYKDFYVKRMAEEAAKVVLPYADPLVIPLGVKFSENNWGECE